MHSAAIDTFLADAAVSNVPGLILAMTFADCVPIFLWDEEHAACGIVHAGWRGTALQVASTAVVTMSAVFGSRPAAMRAGIGPSIGPCCYFVGPEVVAAVSASYPAHAGVIVDGKLDLRKTNYFDLVAAGLSGSNIETSGICTSCRTDLFFSHRAESGITGRFGGGIGLAGNGTKPSCTLNIHEHGSGYRRKPAPRPDQ